jgi:hypothetical protein
MKHELLLVTTAVVCIVTSKHGADLAMHGLLLC